MRTILATIAMLSLARGAEPLPEDRGAAGLLQSLKLLNRDARVLYVTAHPDDEDPALLTFLSRGLGAQVTMLILTHGEGGANVVSGDFFESLGALRTLEMRKAAQYYGVQVRYTRAVDKGFSKTMAETLRQWNEAELLADVLQITREVDPQVIVSRFNESPRDGHGHHQTAGRMAKLAFRDSPGVRKLYTSNWRLGELVTLKIDTGQFDPLLGRSYAQFGREGYRMHRSQGMSARPAPIGPVWSYLKLEASRVGDASTEESIFDRMPAQERDAGLTELLRAFDARRPEASAPGLALAWQRLPARREAIGGALAQALGLDLEASFSGGPVAQPGSTGKLRMRVRGAAWGGIVYGAKGPVELGPPEADGAYALRVNPGAPPNARIEATAIVPYQGARVKLVQDLDVVAGPAISVGFEAANGLVPLGRPVYEVEVSVKNLTASRRRGSLHVTGAEAQSFDLGKPGDEARLRFRLPTPKKPDTYLEAEARADGQVFNTSFVAVTQPGFGTIYLQRPARHLLRAVDVKVAPGVRIGYVMGSGDEVPQGLRQLGVDVEMLTGPALAGANLLQYSSIWLGIRAYAAREDVRTHNARLLDYVNNGGTLIVQYQTQEYDNGYAPFAYTQGRGAEETSEEDAPVAILAPADPVFQTPNRITAADFEGWVEQRGSKFFATWGPAWTPLIETHDEGQAPQRGVWLSARYGKGTYVYCALAWYRQLPAAVPGAARLVANLASMGK